MGLDRVREERSACRGDYNEEPPHSAIGIKTPIALVD